MIATRKMSPLFGALICVTLASMTSASALTVEVAKKCSALTAKAFPQRETGNPAARSGGGTGISQQSYFQRCVSNGDNGDSATPETEQ
jgi:hypothetical protein